MSPGNRYQRAVDHILKNIRYSLSDELHESIDLTVKAISGANRVFVYGVGRSGLVAQAFAMRLVQLGLKAHFVGEVTTPIVSDKDTVILISNTGETMSAIQTGNIARRMGATVVCITSNETSKLTHVGNIEIILKPDPNDVEGSLAPLGTLFENSSQIFLDGIVAMLMDLRKEKEESMRARHAIWV